MSSKQLFIVIIAVVISTVIADNINTNPVVDTKYGKVRGVKTKDHYEFRKISFAKPPLGDLRFKVLIK